METFITQVNRINLIEDIMTEDINQFKKMYKHMLFTGYNG